MNESSNLSVDTAALRLASSLKIIGVGSGGVTAVRNLFTRPLEGAQWAGMDTDATVLNNSGLSETLLIGSRLTRGLGTGGDPDLGRAAAEAEVEAIRAMGANSDVVILLVGLGGGTASGAAPVVARTLREAGKLVFALATLPFEFEGARRQQQALRALSQLRTAADAVICLPNQKVASLLDANTTFVDTFKTTHRLLGQGIAGLWRLMTREAFIKVDFADLARVVRGRHAESAYATAEAGGENRLREVVDQLFGSPLLDQGQWLGEADAVLVSVVGGQDMTLREINQLMEQVHRRCEKAEVIMGASFDGAISGRLSVTLVASKRPQVEDRPVSGEAAEPEETAMPICHFPLPGTRPAEVVATPQPEARNASRFVPMPPELPKDKLEEIFSRQPASSEKPKRRSGGPRQGLLPLEAVSKGRFAKSEPTIHRGEDLDTPTYIRRGVPLNERPKRKSSSFSSPVGGRGPLPGSLFSMPKNPSVMALGVGSFACGMLQPLKEAGSRVSTYLTRTYAHYPPSMVGPTFNRDQYPNPCPLLKDQKVDLVIPMSIDWAQAPWQKELLDSGVPIFSPIGEAMRLERERDFARALCRKHGVAFPAAHVAANRLEAEKLLERSPRPFVIKNPLCSPTSPIHTILCQTLEDTRAWLKHIDYAEGVFLQEYLGPLEAGHLALVSGGELYSLGTNQEYKRAFTGGLGIVAGAPLGGLVEQDPGDKYGLAKELLRPLLPWFREVNYHGPVQVTAVKRGGRWHVIEYNIRLGVTSGIMLMRMLKQPGRLLLQCAKNEKLKPEFHEQRQFGCSVTLAGYGYPFVELSGPPMPVEIRGTLTTDVWWNEVARDLDGQLMATGHRIADVLAYGETLPAAVDLAYENIQRIRSLGSYYRTDVGRCLWPPGTE